MTATMYVVDRGVPSAAFAQPPAIPPLLDELMAAVCAVAGAVTGVLHRAGAGPLACEAMFPADVPERLEALRQVIALRARTAGRHAIDGHADTWTMAVGTRTFGDLWLALGFAADDPDGALRAARLEQPIRSLIVAQVDALYDLVDARRREVALTATLDHSECGIIALRDDYSVLFTNAAAAEILTDRDGMELRRNVPRPTSYHDAIRFQEALDCVLMAGPRLRAKRRAMMLMLERDGHKRPLIAVLAPAQADDEADTGELAVIYLMRPERSDSLGLDPICHLHGLSPVETQLVGHLMAGLTVAEAAAAMRVKPDTARAYLKQVFVKTDTHRQAELMQLLLRYQRAVRGDFAFSAA